MATTNIELDIENITGVADADDQLIISAQKFVVSSIPEDLLSNYIGRIGGSNDGSAMSHAKNDSIIEVQRNGYSCRKISLGDSKWAADSNSLKYATALNPVWYWNQSGINILPATDGSNVGYAFVIDSSKIDDDSDLRNIVINYASSKEFSKLSTLPSISWDTINAPPTLPSPSFTTPDIAAVTAGSLGTAPTWNPPVMADLKFSDSDNWINTEEDSEMLGARIQDIQARIGDFTARLQEEQGRFNKDNVIYQSTVQEALQELQVASQEAQQEANLLLQKEVQEYQQKLAKYSADLQDYQANVNKVVTINQSQIQLCGHYSQMAEKYYNWALAEVKQYIENNNKTLGKAMAMKAGGAS
tara:strand:- start:1277 stop:2350 length:1074 start_codon:yes stop_codon:yes gene_type:complete